LLEIHRKILYVKVSVNPNADRKMPIVARFFESDLRPRIPENKPSAPKIIPAIGRRPEHILPTPINTENNARNRLFLS